MPRYGHPQGITSNSTRGTPGTMTERQPTLGARKHAWKVERADHSSALPPSKRSRETVVSMSPLLLEAFPSMMACSILSNTMIEYVSLARECRTESISLFNSPTTYTCLLFKDSSHLGYNRERGEITNWNRNLLSRGWIDNSYEFLNCLLVFS
jgi:hypothetical protein